MANDYALIVDQKTPNDISIVYWMAPEIVELSPETMDARALLSQFAVIGVTNIKVSKLGEMTTQKVQAPQIRTISKSILKPLKRDSLPPVVSSSIELIGGMFSNGLGKMGKGISWHVFDATELQSCQSGGFEVAFAGEIYLYETPIPGCERES